MTNSSIKISSFETAYNATDGSTIFTFPNNPYVIAPSTSTKKQLISIPFRSISTGMDFEAVAPTQIVLTGTFFGSDRATNLSKLAYWCYSKDIKRLYFTSTKFIYVWGITLPQTFNSNRSQFIDYQAVFQSPFPYFITAGTNGAYSTTETPSVDGTGKNIVTITNTSGLAPLYIMKFEITPTAGTITKVEICESTGSYTLDTDKCLIWEDTTGFSTGTLEIWLFKSANNIIKLHWCCKASNRETEFGSRQISSEVIDGLKADAYGSLTLKARINNGEVAATGTITSSYFTSASYTL